MNPRLNAIQIILRSFIHCRTNNSWFFHPLPSLKIGGELSGANCPGGELSDIRSVTAHCCVILPGITKLKSCIRSTYFQLWNKLKLPIFYKTSSHKLKAFVIVWNRNVTFILTIKPILGFHQSCDQN